MKIERWAMVHRRDPYTAPECVAFVLEGDVYGHPNHVDGHTVETSTLIGKRGDKVVTKNSEYELGEPHPEYEKQFPNAKQRLLTTLNEI